MSPADDTQQPDVGKGDGAVTYEGTVTCVSAPSPDDPRLGWLRPITDRARGDAYAVKQGRNYFTRDEPLTADVLYQHLNGGPHIGLYLFAAGGTDEVRCAVYDLDDHDGVVGWETMRGVAGRLGNAALRRGLWPWPVRSGGGQGIHLWFIWDESQPAAGVRAVMLSALAEIGFSEGTAGVAVGQIEVFPKQNFIGDGDYGSLVGLPFARASVPLDVNFEETTEPFAFNPSGAVPQAPAAPKPVITGPSTIQIEWVVEALAQIPNSEMLVDRTADFDKYVGVGMAVFACTGGREAGFKVWDDWAKQHPRYNQQHNTGKAWKYWRRHPPSRTGWGALIKKAREHTPNWLPNGYPIAFSEQWLALEFVTRHEHDLRFVAVWSKWYHFDGARWRRDDTMRAFSLAQSVCRDLASGAQHATTQMRVNSGATRAAVVALARENPALATVPEQWNADPWLLGTSGGVVDLRTGQLSPASPEHYISMATVVAPGGECALWLRTLSQICDDDKDLVSFLKRWFGYCLTGLTREEKMMFFLGRGLNGKGTVIETILYVMGDYATPVAMTTLVKTRHHEHATEIAKLFKVRLAVASETEDGGRINAARIKLLTGGDALTGRYMRADYFDFTPTHKLVISGNRPLIVGRRDKAIERRWNTIKFDQVFEQNTRLKAALRAEAGGILSWLIEGCLEWQRTGLKVPEKVQQATEAYLAEQDDIGQFIIHQCETDAGAETLQSELYWGWRQWCVANGIWAGSSPEFTNRLAARFKVTRPQNKVTFHGIKLRRVQPEFPTFPEFYQRDEPY